ncbi:MAG: ParB/RepB/Spo0J family partition protein [Planctomyces sp.]
MKHHPFAQLFPMQSDDEIQTLADDIRANGLRQPIVIDDNDEILDGRNRAAACAIAGVTPVYEPFIGSDAEKLAFVVSLNLHRRHLTTSQLAMVAEKLAGLKHGQKKSDSGVPLSQATQTEAATLLNVSVDSVKQARKVRKKATPEVIAAVERGELSLNAAVATVKPAVAKPSTATAEPEVEKKSPSVIQIQCTLMKMGKDKKRHPQLIQIAREAVHRMTAGDRIAFLASTVVWLESDQQRQFQDAVREKQDALDAEAESYAQ